MTKQLHSFPDLETKNSRANFVAVSKYSSGVRGGKPPLRKLPSYFNAAHELKATHGEAAEPLRPGFNLGQEEGFKENLTPRSSRSTSGHGVNRGQRKVPGYLATTYEEGLQGGGLTPRKMDTNNQVQLEEGVSQSPPKVRIPSVMRARREESRFANQGDDTTPRLNHEDRTKSQPAMLPPIDALATIPDGEEDGKESGPQGIEGGESQSPKGAFKLPVASRYQLYSIGLTYNAAGKDKKERRSKKKPQTYREINSRRMKMKGGNNRDDVPELPSTGVNKTQEQAPEISIRKKIDQYRNWHEEQYRQKLKDLKTDVEKEKQAEILKIATLKKKNSAKLNKPTAIKMSHRASSSDHTLPRLNARGDHNVPAAVAEVDENVMDNKDDKETASKGKENDRKSNKHSSNKTHERVSSSKTWKTWRDANDSYAYTDVKKYIKENELMDDEKEKYINEWIDNVSFTDSGAPSIPDEQSDTKSYATLRSNGDVA